jgi:hypothetical protein
MQQVFSGRFWRLLLPLWLGLGLAWAGCPRAGAQSAQVRGRVTDSLGQAVASVSVALVGTQRGTTTDAAGRYSLAVPVGAVRLRFRHVQHREEVRALALRAGEVAQLDLVLRPATQVLEAVEIREAQERRGEVSTLNISPLALRQVPTPFGDFNQALATIGLGVVTNSELSTAYAVRGGSFDENLVYVNGIEIYRPFLVRAGEQEGLSFVNPDLVQSVEFSSGGWQPKYGDKLSSVLNIQYKTPEKFAASASAGLLGGTAHLEGASRGRRFTYLAGARYKSARYLLNTLETRGQYLPRFVDGQAFFNWALGKKTVLANLPRTNLAVLLSVASNRYEVRPQDRQTDFGTFAQAFRLSVGFDGGEQLSYTTGQVGLNLSHYWTEKLKSSLIVSGLRTQEREYQNVEGAYRLCDVNTNLGSPDFNRCVLVRGAGSLYEYGRNALDANIWSVESRNEYRASATSRWEFGLRYAREAISDRLSQYGFVDSADYVTVTSRVEADLALASARFMGYVQHTRYLGQTQTLTYGLRFNHWDVNGQWLVAPRVQYAIRPRWRRDISFNLAAGLYQQPPFYRELRNFAGQLNRDLQAQESAHLIAGLDWNFKQWGRPFKFIGEVYAKSLWNVVPYDMDNLRLRYYATNSARAYVAGADFRLSGEFVKGTESWFALSVLTARERVAGDERGYIRRPTDQRVTFTSYFEDHLPNNPSVRVNLRVLYGSGLPFGPAGFPSLRAAFRGPAYRRVDIGFSKIINFKKSQGLQSLWLGLEVLNLFGIDNTISYLWIRDFAGTQYAIPNGLSQRFFNLRVVARLGK